MGIPIRRSFNSFNSFKLFNFGCSFAALSLTPVAHGQAPASGFTRSPAAETVVLPRSVPDPLEPVNRVMWAFNRGLMTGVVKPTSRVYRFVVRKPIRTGIGNFDEKPINPAGRFDD